MDREEFETYLNANSRVVAIFRRSVLDFWTETYDNELSEPLI